MGESQSKITNDPSPDQAKYLNSSMKLLNEDKTKLWKAASHAQQAVDSLAGDEQDEL